ncbi:PREDICTED: rRNA biogenesis protein RRP36-like isoform X2 [Wasmannia auropunctata]|uniref:rRNA biogenesis protein RRP36-like isoform X2 n=1 Tax=Wasmannia auropunctata TaxID=64793 RepID=UPI0005EE8651|nr:PREDICTED: rRNA biogenesis protein RRP36-like isoform X2 [Wasmannia auropunctata]
MLPMAEDTDGLDTDKETRKGMRKKKRNILYDDDDDDDDDDGDEDHIEMSKGKKKALPVPPPSTYKKKQLEIRNSSSVRNALQRLKNQRAEKKNRINTINERSQTEEEMVDDIQEKLKKRCAEDTNVELEKARKRIQERREEKAKQEREKEAHLLKKPGTIDKENEMPSSQYDSQLRSPDFRSEFLPLINEVENDIDKMMSITTCRSISALDHPKFATFSCSNSAATNQSQSSHQPYMSYSKTSPSVPNARNHVQKIMSAPLMTNESNLDQDRSSSSAGVLLILKAVLTKQEEFSRKLQNMDHKLDLVVDLVRTAEDVQKPEGWPTFPLVDVNSFYEWELFLQNNDNYDFAVSHFSVVVGKGTHEGEMATNICKKLFSPEVASNLNWAGTEIKKGIKSMKCGECIIACAKQYKGNFLKSKITGSISTWLRSHLKRRATDNC